MRDQEPLINKYFDLLIQRLQERSGKPVDMVEYYEFATVDIISDLAFGESFDCLEKEEMHVSQPSEQLNNILLKTPTSFLFSSFTRLELPLRYSASCRSSILSTKSSWHSLHAMLEARRRDSGH